MDGCFKTWIYFSLRQTGIGVRVVFWKQWAYEFKAWSHNLCCLSIGHLWPWVPLEVAFSFPKKSLWSVQIYGPARLLLKPVDRKALKFAEQQLCEYTETHWIALFKWVNYSISELYLSKIVKNFFVEQVFNSSCSSQKVKSFPVWLSGELLTASGNHLIFVSKENWGSLPDMLYKEGWRGERY